MSTIRELTRRSPEQTSVSRLAEYVQGDLWNVNHVTGTHTCLHKSLDTVLEGSHLTKWSSRERQIWKLGIVEGLLLLPKFT